MRRERNTPVASPHAHTDQEQGVRSSSDKEGEEEVEEEEGVC